MWMCWLLWVVLGGLEGVSGEVLGGGVGGGWVWV